MTVSQLTWCQGECQWSFHLQSLHLFCVVFVYTSYSYGGGRLNFFEFIKEGTDGGPVTFRAHMRKWLMVNQVCDDFLLTWLYCLFWFFVCVFLHVFVYHSVLCNLPSNCAWEIEGLLKSSMFTSYIFIIMPITFPVL